MLREFGASVDNNEVFNGTVMFGSSGDPPVSKQCLDIVLHILCASAAPPCNPESGLLMLFCKESCRFYQQLIDHGICSEIDIRIQDLKENSVTPAFRKVAEIYFNFNCYDPVTYYFMNVTNPDPSRCTKLLSPEHEGES